MPGTSASTLSARRAELGATARLSWPLAAANILQMLVHSVDVLFVARLGERPLAAAALAIALFSLIAWTLTGFTGIVSAFIAEELGRKRHAVREVRRSVRMGLWLAILSGALGMGICMLGEPFMLATGQNPEIAAMAGEFLRIIMWAMIPTVAASVLRNAVSALGYPVYATAITAGSLVVSLIANYALVFGNLGAPALGLTGSAQASVITATLVLLAYCAAIYANRRLRRFRLAGRFWMHEWQRFAEMFRLGLPISLTIFAEGGLFSGAAFVMGLIGEAQLAAHTIALQLAALAFQIPFGIGQAATIRVGYFFGAGKREAMGRAGNSALTIATATQLAAGALFLIAPELLIRLYVDPANPNNAQVVHYALTYLQIAALFQLADGIQTCAAGALRGLQDTQVPMWIALFSYWVPGAGTAVLLGLYTPLAGRGVWLGFAAGLSVAAILLLWRWFARERLGLMARS